jgi:hypothetical protein
VFSKITTKYKDLDYVSIWFKKGVDYIAGKDSSSFCFVTTNSICQGDHVGLLWPLLLRGTRICIAYQSFKWSNNAKDVAGVTVNIIGLCNRNNKKQNILVDKETTTSAKHINPYLIEADDLIVYPRSKNINDWLPEMPKGNMPYGKALVLSKDERDKIIKDYPEANMLIRRFVNAKSFINSDVQYCLWIHNNEIDTANNIPPIKERIEKTREDRLKSTDPGAHKLALRAHQFRETNEPTEKSLCIPSTSSERREYIPMGYLNNNTIANNATFVIYDAEPWLFALLESKMHMAWIRTVCGKLKTDYRYSSSLGYNTFPVPPLNPNQKEKLNDSAMNILMARENHTEMTLAQMYDPDKMPEDLRNAHDANDLLVDKLYQDKAFLNDEKRLAKLFAMYEELTKDK